MSVTMVGVSFVQAHFFEYQVRLSCLSHTKKMLALLRNLCYVTTFSRVSGRRRRSTGYNIFLFLGRAVLTCRGQLLFWRFPTGSTGDNHRHHPAFHHRIALNDGGTLQHLCNLIQPLTPNIWVTHLSSTELDTDSHPVTFSQKLLNLACLDIYVMIVCTWPHTNLFECNSLLILARLVFFLRLLILILTV